jgi:hypothetical protein
MHPRGMRMPMWDREGLTEKWGIDAAKTLLKTEMKKRGLTYGGLVEVLKRNGIEENERNLRNKVSKGAFSAAFFFQCMLAMRVQNLDLSHEYVEMDDILRDINRVMSEDD